eukprot:gnl/MRDRNA2_/MRDRNA2_84249_c0_seq1.p1 gnl/MRDRNA2_/MRDRNA2_84249_c0~~gnl/MRDRNA2_/MRDRNA2_84249_c0_seq1.p1  ORF type:complete len:115 (+),score=12.46 gnl/MRDRNA2_/MRDRNA2_84249_c0_seq1:84-428(+)
MGIVQMHACCTIEVSGITWFWAAAQCEHELIALTLRRGRPVRKHWPISQNLANRVWVFASAAGGPAPLVRMPDASQVVRQLHARTPESALAPQVCRARRRQGEAVLAMGDALGG